MLYVQTSDLRIVVHHTTWHLFVSLLRPLLPLLDHRNQSLVLLSHSKAEHDFYFLFFFIAPFYWFVDSGASMTWYRTIRCPWHSVGKVVYRQLIPTIMFWMTDGYKLPDTQSSEGCCYYYMWISVQVC